MSSYSFSHQFYQHWTQAPKLVRAAIVQELMEINTLLQPDTELADFNFSEPDLDSHIEALYNAHHAELAVARAIADEQQRADKQRLAEKNEENRKAEEKKTLEKKEAEEKADIQENQAPSNDKDSDDQQQEQQNTLNNSNSSLEVTESTIKTGSSKGHVNSNKDKVLSALQLQANADTVEHSPTTETLAKTATLDKEAVIHELGIHIDDYLSEQMAQLSEDLKSWLRAEISRKISEQVTASDSSNDKK